MTHAKEKPPRDGDPFSHLENTEFVIGAASVRGATGEAVSGYPNQITVAIHQEGKSL